MVTVEQILRLYHYSSQLRFASHELVLMTTSLSLPTARSHLQYLELLCMWMKGLHISLSGGPALFVKNSCCTHAYYNSCGRQSELRRWRRNLIEGYDTWSTSLKHPNQITDKVSVYHGKSSIFTEIFEFFPIERTVRNILKHRRRSRLQQRSSSGSWHFYDRGGVFIMGFFRRDGGTSC